MRLMLFSLVPAIIVAVGCTNAAQLASEGSVHVGMSKYALRDALFSTFPSEDPFLDGCYRQYDPNRRIEILAPKSLSVFFVFTDVETASAGCGYTSLGDGALAGWKFSESSALAFVDNLHRPAPPALGGRSDMPNSAADTHPGSRDDLQKVGSGTGFIINAHGYVLTNEHVILGCSSVQSQLEGITQTLTHVASDSVNDLALLRLPIPTGEGLQMSAEGPQLGEDVVVAGYPFSDSLSGSVKVTRGIVSSLSGPGNNSSIIQIDAAVQPGSSGGPIFNQQAQVIGIVIAQASAEYFLTTTGALPENVNFGVTVGTASAFLKSANVTFTRGEESAPPITVQEVAKEAQRYTIQLHCLE